MQCVLSKRNAIQCPGFSLSLSQPENLLRRLEVIKYEEDPKESILKYYELDNVTYLTNTTKHQEMYDKTRAVSKVTLSVSVS